MNSNDDKRDPNESGSVTSITVLGTHLFWFAIGPLIMLFILWEISTVGSGWTTVLDAVFFSVVVLMVCCRWLDQRSGQGTTGAGERSTWRDFRRYALTLPMLAVPAWIVANLVGNHILDGG